MKADYEDFKRLGFTSKPDYDECKRLGFSRRVNYDECKRLGFSRRVDYDECKRLGFASKQTPQISKEALKNQFKTYLAQVDPKTTVIMSEMETLKAMERSLKEERKMVPKTMITDLRGTGIMCTECRTCHFTCHYDCSTRGHDKKGCSVIVNGRCTICPKKCPVEDRFDTHNVYKTIYVEEEVDEFGILVAYYTLLGKKYNGSTKESVLTSIEIRLREIEAELVDVRNNAKSCVDLLSRIHL